MLCSPLFTAFASSNAEVVGSNAALHMASLLHGLRASVSAAVNVTAQLISWNSTQSPVVSHNSVYTIAPLGSKQFLSFDLRDTLAEAGVKLSSMSQYFMHLTVRPHLTPCLRCAMN